ncbi:uroporphyrinogen-III synthase [Ramlibacter sp. H39-3-26]|uniref:uroporphyrinogen-III synthase n=1 Tax=Curvibacter soli TaxID=3031331 RepID=UPI0023D9A9B1|nr:uroporphyrinogen-III synthase [Ramlibacter sp. H39-3-26]MDF1485051.1 uroporphyrinogen-III synthase [Ramlibacter sp. H39-3-26]
MQVIVTRPAAEAGPWVRALAARGIAAAALPLIGIAPLPDPAPLRAAWAVLPAYRAVMFVSRSAVAHFFAARPLSAAWPAGPRAWAPGAGTAQALREAGVPVGSIDAPAADAARMDSEALWALVAPQARAGDRVLLVRGSDGADAGPAGADTGNGRDWLAQQIAAARARVEAVAAYLRQPPVLDAAQRALAQAAANDGSLWLFSSAQAIAHLRAALPAQGWRAARALATHPRIAEAARAAGFGAVALSAPGQDAVIASIESLA